MTRQLVVTRAGSVVVLTLTRDSSNRVTQQMAEELVEALESARRDRNVSGCVLTGHGDVFCLGGDYRGAGAATAGRMEFGRAHINVFNAMARLENRLSPPSTATLTRAASAWWSPAISRSWQMT